MRHLVVAAIALITLPATAVTAGAAVVDCRPDSVVLESLTGAMLCETRRPGDPTLLIVVESVRPNGLAATEGLRPGDVIDQVDRRRPASARDATVLMARAQTQPVLVNVRRDAAPYLFRLWTNRP